MDLIAVTDLYGVDEQFSIVYGVEDSVFSRAHSMPRRAVATWIAEPLDCYYCSDRP